MGYNRSGQRRKEKEKRHKKMVKRLLAKMEKEEAVAKPVAGK